MFNDGFPNAVAAGQESAPIYFLHIPKTAGTSFNQFLESRFGPDDTWAAHLWSHVAAGHGGSTDGKRLIWGHFYSYFASHHPGPLRYVTFLRDPVERALSHYGHVMQHASHYLHRRAHALGSFGAYIRDPQTSTTVANFQVTALALDLDARALYASLDARQVEAMEMEWRLETRSVAAPELGVETIGGEAFERRVPYDAMPSADELLARAKGRLAQICCVGIAERYAESLELVCRRFGWTSDTPPQALNTNPGRVRREDISLSDLDHLLSINQEDIALYRYACAQLNEALQRA